MLQLLIESPVVPEYHLFQISMVLSMVSLKKKIMESNLEYMMGVGTISKLL